MTSESGAREKEKQGGPGEGRGKSAIPAGSLGTNGKKFRKLPPRSAFL